MIVISAKCFVDGLEPAVKKLAPESTLRRACDLLLHAVRTDDVRNAMADTVKVASDLLRDPSTEYFGEAVIRAALSVGCAALNGEYLEAWRLLDFLTNGKEHLT